MVLRLTKAALDRSDRQNSPLRGTPTLATLTLLVSSSLSLPWRKSFREVMKLFHEIS
jgi:hypothetical protein